MLKLQVLPHKEHIPSPFVKPLDLFSVGELFVFIVTAHETCRPTYAVWQKNILDVKTRASFHLHVVHFINT